jgi:osomolarity two-component system sensor histidine kinase NIK1
LVAKGGVMAATTSGPVRATGGIDLDQLHAFTHALHRGDFSFRFAMVPGMSWKAEEIAIGLNRHLEQMQYLLFEVSRVCDELGARGELGPQVEHTFDTGPWKQMVDAVNRMAANLTMQLRDMNRTARRAAAGDYSRPVTCDCQGETRELKTALNEILEQHRDPDGPG